MAIKPPRLQPGDMIGIVAPASNVWPERLAAGAAELQRLGFRTKYLDSIFEKTFYTAGTDEQRAEQVNAMFADPEVRAIVAARGGYGSARILPLLNVEVIEANPKIFMGYSDISTLLLYFQRMFDWVVFHGPMVAGLLASGEGHYDEDLLRRVLCRAQPAGRVDTAGAQVLHRGRARGRLVGGCLPMLIGSLATEYEIDTRDTILFIEDHGSKPYQIDRMMTHLRMAGKLDPVGGLIFGQMTDCIQHPDQGYVIEDVITECIRGLDVPVLFGLRSGDSVDRNLVLPLGVEAALECSAAATALSIEESAVRL